MGIFREGLNIFTSKATIPDPADALPGRAEQVLGGNVSHEILGTRLLGPYPEGTEIAIFAMGCFWGAERTFWQLDGVHTTVAGYSGGYTKNPTYEEVCSGRTGQAEAVLVAFDPRVISYDQLLAAFWESHDPTQGMRQGNDVGSQYRSAIYWKTPAQQEQALASRQAYQQALTASGMGRITTEIAEAGPFYPAEEYHQQYLAKQGFPVEGGYCGMQPTGVSV